MKITYAIAASLLFAGSGLAKAEHGDADAVPYGGRTILIMVPDDQLAIPFTINADGTMTYVDIHLWDTGLAESYIRTVPYEIRGDKQETFCVIKETSICMDFPPLKTSEPQPISVTTYDEEGKEAFSGRGILMLMEERAPYPVTKKTSG